MRLSFRLRLAFSTALLAAIALAGFAAIARWQMYASKLVVIDREIANQAERELARDHPPDHWWRHERNMGRAFANPEPEQILLLVKDVEGEIYRSDHWPQSLSVESLLWPDRPASSQEISDDSPSSDPRRKANRRRPSSFVIATHVVNGRHWRIGLATGIAGRQLAVGVDLAIIDMEILELRNAFLLAAPLALGFIALGAWHLSGRALVPIRTLSATMAELTAQGLNRRLALAGKDLEFRQLIEIFNSMLERLERSFQQASRFSADAAHELKTPLAILQGQLERAILHCETGSAIQKDLTIMLDEIQRLSNISRKLLLLSRADAGQLRLNLDSVDLSKLLNDLLEDAQILAPELKISGSIECHLQINADAELLRQVLHNLLSNAIKFNQPNGWIRIDAIRKPGLIQISISNASSGIPHNARERIFERFYRGDASHSRQIEGIGLGLSLAREIVRAHHGVLRLTDSREGEVCFLMTLPD